MNYTLQQLELKKIQEMINRVQNSIASAPQGKLYCGIKRKKYPEYYILPNESSEGIARYLKRSELDLARGLAQKEYDEKILKKLMEEEKILLKSLRYEHLEAMKDIYDRLPEAKKRLVTPYVLPDEEFVKQWKARFVGESNGIPIIDGYETEAGEMVRSKSEKMIADKLLYRGIPYVYEAPLKLKGYPIMYPDFTLLNVRTRKTYFHEHFGMMDNPEYCAKALGKLAAYESNGMFIGESLLITMESSQKRINLQAFDRVLQQYLK